MNAQRVQRVINSAVIPAISTETFHVNNHREVHGVTTRLVEEKRLGAKIALREVALTGHRGNAITTIGIEIKADEINASDPEVTHLQNITMVAALDQHGRVKIQDNLVRGMVDIRAIINKNNLLLRLGVVTCIE